MLHSIAWPVMTATDTAPDDTSMLIDLVTAAEDQMVTL